MRRLIVFVGLMAWSSARAEPSRIADLDALEEPVPAILRAVFPLRGDVAVARLDQRFGPWTESQLHLFSIFGGPWRRLELDLPADARYRGTYDGWAYLSAGAAAEALRTDGRSLERLPGLTRLTRPLVTLGGAAYVTGAGDDGRFGLVRLDPGGASAVRLRAFDGEVQGMAVVGDELVLLHALPDRRELLRSDGTPAGTVVVPLPADGALLHLGAALPGGIVAWMRVGEADVLRRIGLDGQVSDVLSRPARWAAEVAPTEIRASGGSAWLTLTSTTDERATELWRVDGGQATRLLSGTWVVLFAASGRDLVAGVEGALVSFRDGLEFARRSLPDRTVSGAVILGERILYTARARTGGRETSYLLRDEGDDVPVLETSGRTAVFRVGDSLLVRDETRPSGEIAVVDPLLGASLLIPPGPRLTGSSHPRFFPVSRDVTVMATTVGETSGLLWATDGRALQQIRAGTVLTGATWEGRFYWLGRDSATELRGFDPRTNAQRLIRSVGQWPGFHSPVLLALASGLIVLDRGQVALFSDGTPEGTVRAEALPGGVAWFVGVDPGRAALLGTALEDGSWRLESTEGAVGSRRAVPHPEGMGSPLAALPVGSGWVVLAEVTPPGEPGIFFVDEGSGGARRLPGPRFASEGVVALGRAGARAVFSTSSGTLFVDVEAGGTMGEAFPAGARAAASPDGRLFVLGGRPGQLWVTDGTGPGTASLAVESGGPLLSAGSLAPVNGGVVFPFYDDEAGVEPWFSDGTPEGTRRLVDLAPGAAPGGIALTSWPVPPVPGSNLVVVDEHLLLPGYDPRHGIEPWRIPLADIPCLLACCIDAHCPGGGRCIGAECVSDEVGGEPIVGGEGCGCGTTSSAEGRAALVLVALLGVPSISRRRRGAVRADLDLTRARIR